MKTEETILEINLTALEKNIHYLKNRLKPTTLFLAVVKASSYGNNSVAIASHLQKKGLANYFAVAYTSEGIALRKAGVTLPILVLHPQPINFGDIVKYNLEPTLYSQRIAKLFLGYAEKQQLADYPVHLKCNTGLNRLGFDLSEIEEVLTLLKNNTTVKVKTAYSHLAASEDMNEKEFTENQINTFIAFQEKITKSSITAEAENSGALGDCSENFYKGRKNTAAERRKCLSELYNLSSKIKILKDGKTSAGFYPLQLTVSGFDGSKKYTNKVFIATYNSAKGYYSTQKDYPLADKDF